VICAYLERTHPNPPLYPSDPYDYARALWFEEYADGGLVTVIGPKVFFQKVVGPKILQSEDRRCGRREGAQRKSCRRCMTYLEGELAAGTNALVGKSS